MCLLLLPRKAAKPGLGSLFLCSSVCTTLLAWLLGCCGACRLLDGGGAPRSLIGSGFPGRTPGLNFDVPVLGAFVPTERLGFAGGGLTGACIVCSRICNRPGASLTGATGFRAEGAGTTGNLGGTGVCAVCKGAGRLGGGSDTFVTAGGIGIALGDSCFCVALGDTGAITGATSVGGICI